MKPADPLLASEPYEIRILSRARRAVALENASYNLHRRVGLPNAITEAFDEGVREIARTPNGFTEFKHVKGRPARTVYRHFLERVRYHVYYRVSARIRVVTIVFFCHAMSLPPKL